MKSVLNPPLLPRRGAVLQVLGITRVTQPDEKKRKTQRKKRPRPPDGDERSLVAQENLLRSWLQKNYGEPFELTLIASTGSGEKLNRKESAQAAAAVESGRFDLVLAEDLGRIFRRIHAYLFCEKCEDHKVRLIALNDIGVDTGRPEWRMAAHFACMRHKAYNRDTAERIRRTLRSEFRFGGVVQTFIYGYVKSDDAETDEEITRDPTAVPIYEEMVCRLENGASYSEVADCLNRLGTPVGFWCRSEKWTGRMVRRVIFNPILKGLRVRNSKISVRINESGDRKSVNAPPEDLLVRECPHLAFIEPDRYDRLIRMLKAKHAGCARGRKAGAADCRAGVSKKHTVWPGQHVVCGVCGSIYVWGGHGQNVHLMCDGARGYACWKGATFDGNKAGPRLAAAVLDFAESLPGFDDAFFAKAKAQALTRRSDRAERLRRLDQQIGQVERELARLVDAVATTEFSPALRAKLQETEDRKAHLVYERDDVRHQPDDMPELPSIEELNSRARAAIGGMAFADPAYGRLMHQLIPKIEVFPFRLIDGGAVVLRARLTITLAPLLGTAADSVGPLLMRTVMVDLFDPPQRVAFREQVMELRATRLSERAVAQKLGLTVAAAQNAMAMHRMMVAAGVTDPYRLVTAPPEDGKIRRHIHPRYGFRPRPGYPAWPESPEQNAA